MANTLYITAGLPVAKNSGQSPSSGVNTAYISAGLPPEPITSDPLDLADDTFSIESPFAEDDPVGTVEATGGTTPYSYEIISQRQVSA